MADASVNLIVNVEYLVKKFKSYSPEIDLKYPGELDTSYFMIDAQRWFCPPKTQIRNSDTMAVTLYSSRTLDSSNQWVYDEDTATTYKFTGEVGQFPKLFTLDMYDETANQYSSRQLVRLLDVSAYYNNHTITINLHDFSYIDGYYPVFSTNVIMVSQEESIDLATYTYEMSSMTTAMCAFPSIQFVNNSEEYKSYEFYVYFTGNSIISVRTLITNPYTNPVSLPTLFIIENISEDFAIDIYATRKDRINVYINTDGTVDVYDNAETTATSDDEYLIVSYPGTSGLYTTAYASINKFSFAIVPGDAALYESYNYVFKIWEKNEELDEDGTYSQSVVEYFDGSNIDFNTRLKSDDFLSSSESYASGLVYDENITYTLDISTNKIYQGSNISFIMPGNYGRYMIVTAYDEAHVDGVVLAGTESLNRTVYTYVTFEDGQSKVWLTVAFDDTEFDGAELINGARLQDSKGNSITSQPLDINTHKEATLMWSQTLKSNIPIYIIIEEIELIDITVTRNTELMGVAYDMDFDNELVFNNNTATYTTTVDNPTEMILYISNEYIDDGQLTAILYANNIIYDEYVVLISRGFNTEYKIAGLNSTGNYRLTLDLSESYYTKSIILRLYNNGDSDIALASTGIQHSIDGESNWENLVVTEPVIVNEGEQSCLYYSTSMSAGYYIKYTVNLNTAYEYSDVSIELTIDGRGVAEITPDVTNSYGTLTLNDTRTVADVTLYVPASCYRYYIYEYFTATEVYNVYILTQSSLDMLVFWFLNYDTSAWTEIAFENNEWNTTTSLIKPQEIQLQVNCTDYYTYGTLYYYLYEYGSTSKGRLRSFEFDELSSIDGQTGMHTYTVEDFSNYTNGLVFEAVSVGLKNHTVWITVPLSDTYMPTITTAYGGTTSETIIFDMDGNYDLITFFDTSMAVAYYDTPIGHLNDIAWVLSNPDSESYNIYDIELFRTNDEITDYRDVETASWVSLGSITKQLYSTAFTWSWDTDLEGNSVDYNAYCFRLTNFDRNVTSHFLTMGYDTDPDMQSNIIPTFAQTDNDFIGTKTSWSAYMMYYESSVTALSVDNFYFENCYNQADSSVNKDKLLNAYFSVTGVEATDEADKYRINITTNHNLFSLFYEECDSAGNVTADKYFKEGIVFTDFLTCEINGSKYTLTGTLDRCLYIWFSSNYSVSSIIYNPAETYYVYFYFYEMTQTNYTDGSFNPSFPTDLSTANVIMSPNVLSDFSITTAHSPDSDTDTIWVIYLPAKTTYLGPVLIDIQRGHYRAYSPYTVTVVEEEVHKITVYLKLSNRYSALDEITIDISNSTQQDSASDSSKHILYVTLDKIDEDNELGSIYNYDDTETKFGWLDYTDLSSTSVTVRSWISWTVNGITYTVTGPSFTLQTQGTYEIHLDLNCLAFRINDETTIRSGISCTGSVTRYLQMKTIETAGGILALSTSVTSSSFLPTISDVIVGGYLKVPLVYTYSRDGTASATEKYSVSTYSVYTQTGATYASTVSDSNDTIPWGQDLYYLTGGTRSGSNYLYGYSSSGAAYPIGTIPAKSAFFTSSSLKDE